MVENRGEFRDIEIDKYRVKKNLAYRGREKKITKNKFSDYAFLP